MKQLKAAHKRVHAALERLRAAAAADGVAATTAELEGDPLDVLTAEATGHDLIVIGRSVSCRPGVGRDASPLVKALVRDSPRPVLAFSNAAAAGDRILVAFDGSVPASRSLYVAALLGLVQKVAVQVLSVNADSKVAQELADRAATLLRSHGGDVATAAVASEVDPMETILERVRSFRADTIVMGAYGHGGLRDVIFGSCTRRLLSDCAAALFLQH